MTMVQVDLDAENTKFIDVQKALNNFKNRPDTINFIIKEYSKKIN